MPIFFWALVILCLTYLRLRPLARQGRVCPKGLASHRAYVLRAVDKVFCIEAIRSQLLTNVNQANESNFHTLIHQRQILSFYAF